MDWKGRSSVVAIWDDREEEMKPEVAQLLCPFDRTNGRHLCQGQSDRGEPEGDEAREFSDRGLEVDPRDARLVHNRAVLEYQVGNFAQGNVYLERLIETMRLAPGSLLEREIVPMTVAMALRITGKARHLDIAEAAAESVLSTGSFTPLAISWPRTGLALLAVERGDVAAAEEQYGVLKRWPWAMSPLHRICTTHVLALLAQTMGMSDAAMAHFEEASAFCRKANWKPELAWTCHDYADTLLQRDDPGDREKANSLLDESLAISTELGMRPLMEKVTARRESLSVQPAPVQKYPSNLTERQWEVLQLLAQGKTNREIAQTLVLSDRTVQRHIADIYDKIGARNRSEATAFAMSQLDLPK